MRTGFAGLLAAAAALAVGELVAALIAPSGSPLTAIGGAMIDRTPVPLKNFAIEHFGTNDKIVLIGGMIAVVAVLAFLIGLLARRRRYLAAAILALFGVVGVLAALSRPGSAVVDAVPSVAAALVAAGSLLFLVPRPRPRPYTGGGALAAEPGAGRRWFIVLGVAVVAGGATWFARAREQVGRTFALPKPAITLPPPPPGSDLKIAGLSPFTTPNTAFYRVDTALTVPMLDPSDWTLKISGMVDRPMELSFDEVLKRPLVEGDLTLSCVSNEVGGPYVGNARWLGAPLLTLLREAGVQRGADQLFSTSSDGMTIGTPLEAVMDGRDALLAIAMNGQPLPADHGFPARMIIPGLFGYASATKWVIELELTTFAKKAAYWVERGYVTNGVVKTASRIDVPKPLAAVKAGEVQVAGVAWAQHRGISAVEVRADGGPWSEARLGTVPGIDTWRQWSWGWRATPGTHRLEVRATDGSGRTQEEARVPLFPSGATGWHSVVVTVT